MKEMSNAANERAAAQQALRRGELKDRETYTAKQVAMRCGTDAKTMRKFFRSSFASIEPVGQGGRYEFDASDMPQIKKEFNAWLTRRTIKRPKAASELTPKAPAKKAEAPSQKLKLVTPSWQDEQKPGDVWEVEELINDPDLDEAEPTAEELEALEAMMEEGGI